MVRAYPTGDYSLTRYGRELLSPLMALTKFASHRENPLQGNPLHRNEPGMGKE